MPYPLKNTDIQLIRQEYFPLSSHEDTCEDDYLQE